MYSSKTTSYFSTPTFRSVMADTVKNVLDTIAERESKYKTVEVQKDIAVEIDEGNLLAVDSNEIDWKQLK